jgi:kynureninase
MALSTAIDRSECQRLDAGDPLASIADEFIPGEPGTLYFDANSVGAMPRAAEPLLARHIGEWQRLRRRGWSESTWLDAPRRIGAKLAPILGAGVDEVIVCDTTTLNLAKALSAALSLRPGRVRIVGEAGTFPSDLYVAQGLLAAFPDRRLDLVADGASIEPSLGPDVALLYLSQVDYRTARRHDMQRLTQAAHQAGALVVWDLSHGAGAVPAELDAIDADFAVGCGYKYLCGGPGAPAWIFAARRYHDAIEPLLAGWMGHASPFSFPLDYAPGDGMKRFLVGTPPVIANAVMEAAADLWVRVEPREVFRKHAALGDLVVALADQELARFGVAVASPREARARGGFVALSHPHGASVVAALGDAGVVASFRSPDNIRFGLSALYHRHVDVFDGIARLVGILREQSWQQDKYKVTKSI